MTTRNIHGLTVLAIAALMVGGASLSACADTGWRDMHRDRVDIRRDNRNIHQDRNRIAHLDMRLQRQVNHDHFRMAMRTDRRIDRLHRDIRHDRMDRNHDRRDLRHDG